MPLVCCFKAAPVIYAEGEDTRKKVIRVQVNPDDSRATIHGLTQEHSMLVWDIAL